VNSRLPSGDSFTDTPDLAPLKCQPVLVPSYRLEDVAIPTKMRIGLRDMR